jgi:hypothetical protein
VATERPAAARLLAVAPAGRSVASYTTTGDTTHVAHEGFVLYVKFTQDTDGFYLLISLKDK